MEKNAVSIVHWSKKISSPILFFNEVLKGDTEILLVIEKDAERPTEGIQVKQDVLSFFDEDPELFLIFGDDSDLFLVRRKILMMLFPRVIRIGGDIDTGEILKVEGDERIKKLIPHILNLGEKISCFKDLLEYLQNDPWCRGYLKMEGPYPLLVRNFKESVVQKKNFRDLIFIKAYDQAISEYGSWEEYKKEQWKAFLCYGPEDLLDLSLSLLSGRRVKYPVAALDLAAYTIKKFDRDPTLANIPVTGRISNTRTQENDPVQYVIFHVKFDMMSEWRLHFGAHILARCALISDNPEEYVSSLIQTMKPPHDIVYAAKREVDRIIKNLCPYEIEAEKYLTPESDALKKAKEFFYDERAPSSELMDKINAEVMIEKDIVKFSRN